MGCMPDYVYVLYVQTRCSCWAHRDAESRQPAWLQESAHSLWALLCRTHGISLSLSPLRVVLMRKVCVWPHVLFKWVVCCCVVYIPQLTVSLFSPRRCLCELINGMLCVNPVCVIPNMSRYLLLALALRLRAVCVRVYVFVCVRTAPQAAHRHTHKHGDRPTEWQTDWHTITQGSRQARWVSFFSFFSGYAPVSCTCTATHTHTHVVYPHRHTCPHRHTHAHPLRVMCVFFSEMNPAVMASDSRCADGQRERVCFLSLLTRFLCSPREEKSLALLGPCAALYRIGVVCIAWAWCVRVCAHWALSLCVWLAMSCTYIFLRMCNTIYWRCTDSHTCPTDKQTDRQTLHATHRVPVACATCEHKILLFFF